MKTRPSNSGGPGLRAGGFTLVELLIVITIIVVLLALLTPALDQAVYQSELAVCGSQPRGIAGGAQTYAASYQRHYPARPWNWMSCRIYAFDVNWDWRPMIRDYMPLDMLSDPLCDKLPLDTEATSDHLLTSYALRFSWWFEGQKGMKRLGQSWEWSGDPEAPLLSPLRSSVIAADRERVHRDSWTGASHPDKDHSLALKTEPVGGNEVFVFSRWQRVDGVHLRGPTDRNFAYADGAVVLLRDALVNDPLQSDTVDERLVRVPVGGIAGQAYLSWPAHWQNTVKD